MTIRSETIQHNLLVSPRGKNPKEWSDISKNGTLDDFGPKIYVTHSSKIRRLCLMKWLSEMLQKFSFGATFSFPLMNATCSMST